MKRIKTVTRIGTLESADDRSVGPNRGVYAAVQKRAYAGIVQETYQSQVVVRVGSSGKFLDLRRYKASFENTAHIVFEVDCDPKDWVRIQFFELTRQKCLAFFRQAYPPPGALHSAGAIDRFTQHVGRNNSVSTLSPKELEKKAIESSESAVSAIILAHGIVDRTSQAFADHVAIFLNSGDIAPVWLLDQPIPWLEHFIETHGGALNPDVINGIRTRLYGIKNA